MSVRFSSAKSEYDLIREEWFERIDQIAKTSVFVGGQAVNRFEKGYATYIGTKHALGVGNGTDALFLTLKALGIGPGDEVIVPANTFIATVEAIHHTGALPVLVDCDPQTYLIDMERMKQARTNKTKAVIPVHLYGQMVDIEAINGWAATFHIHVIEDSAQAAGAKMSQKRAGSLGTAGCFSFYPDKNLGAFGDGGGITTSRDDLAEKILLLRNHGSKVRYSHELPGFNSRLDPIQAAVLEIKLKYLDEWSSKRRECANLYESYLNGMDVMTPIHQNDESHVFHVYMIRVEEGIRDHVRKQLQKRGILSAVHYPTPIHLTPAFKDLGYSEGDFIHSETYTKEAISLPMHNFLEEKDIQRVAHALSDALKSVVRV
jgi:dTDP-4-amino-4,6-dideoxygalactose transaminase